MSKLPLIIVAAAFAFGSPPAKATTVDSTFIFTGTCTTDCTNTANATLVLSGYTLGTTITSSNFVSLAYHSSFMSFSVTPAELTSTSPNGLPSSISLPLPGAEFVFLEFSIPGAPNGLTDGFFRTETNGSFCVGGAGECFGDIGTNALWSETPLPAALPLFATGLGALGLLGWRRKRKARAVA